MTATTVSHLWVRKSAARPRNSFPRRLIAFCLGAVAVGAPISVADAEDRPRVLFTAPSGDYVIDYPGGLPEPVDTEAAGMPDNVEVAMFMRLDGNSAYMTARSEGTGVPGSLDGAIRDAIQGIIGVGGVVESQTPLTFRGASGADVVGSLTTQGVDSHFLVRVLLRGSRLYMVLVNSIDPITFDDPEISAFFGSFEFVKGVYR